MKSESLPTVLDQAPPTHRKPVSRILLIVLLFPLLASAKEKPAQKRTCRIVFLAPPADAPKTLFLFDGVASQEVTMPEMNLSPTYKVPAGEAVLSLTPQAVAKGGKVPADAPNAKLPASYGDFYLVITPDPANTVAPVKLQIMDAGPEKFRKGQMIWYNLTPNTISGQLGSQKLELAGQARAIINDPAKANEPFDVNITYLITEDPVPHPISQTQWVHDTRSRMVMFVHGGADNAVPQIAGFKDFRE